MFMIRRILVRMTIVTELGKRELGRVLLVCIRCHELFILIEIIETCYML